MSRHPTHPTADEVHGALGQWRRGFAMLSTDVEAPGPVIPTPALLEHAVTSVDTVDVRPAGRVDDTLNHLPQQPWVHTPRMSNTATPFNNNAVFRCSTRFGGS